jgi:hypothetical protein
MHELGALVRDACSLETLIVNRVIIRKTETVYSTTTFSPWFPHPALKILSIRDSVNNTSALLRVLPLPSAGLSITLLSLHNDNYLSHPISAPYTEVYTAVVLFWMKCTGSDELPNGVLSSEFHWILEERGGWTSYSRLVFGSESNANAFTVQDHPWVYLTMRCRFEFLREIPFATPGLRLIKGIVRSFALRMSHQEEDHHSPIPSPLWPHASRFVGFKKISIEREREATELEPLREWMERCSRMGSRVEQLELKQCSAALEQMAIGMGEDGVVGEVIIHERPQ